MVMQIQIQALLAATGEPNTGSNIEISKPPVFSKEAESAGKFIMACRLYLRMKMREVMVKEQIQWIL